MNIFFLENWQFNKKVAPPLLYIYQAWKTVLTVWQNMKVSEIQKFQFSNSLVSWEKFGSTALANIKKITIFNLFHELAKIEKPN